MKQAILLLLLSTSVITSYSFNHDSESNDLNIIRQRGASKEAFDCYLDETKKLENCDSQFPYVECKPLIVKNAQMPEERQVSLVAGVTNMMSMAISNLRINNFLEADPVPSFDGKCTHKGIWPPLTMDFIGTFVLILIMALATMGGIGGGGVVVLII